MKVFISQPMRGKTESEIEAQRAAAISTLGEDAEVIGTQFAGDFLGSRLQFLGKSIMDGLAQADAALFIGDWEKYDGCRCEHFIAAQYGIKCMYM